MINTLKADEVMIKKNDNKTYNYDESLIKSTEYFNGNDLAAKVFLDKYALRDNNDELIEQTPDQMHWRLAKEFARIEKKKFNNPISKEDIFFYLDHFSKIIPQGSPMYGIGNNFQTISLSNCFSLESPADSYSGICSADEQLVQISKRRGGCGLDISNLRPCGTSTSNAAKTSTGIIPFAERYSNSIREVGQYGRRGALIETLSVHHPQILDFANAKKDLKKITGANISIRLTDEFLEAVKKDKDYEQRWPVDAREYGNEPKISKYVKAKEVWSDIIKNAWASAEPGLIFWDNIIKESPADCYSDQGFKTISTNPCSELPLCANDSCRLLLVNVFAFVKLPFTDNATFDFEEFTKVAKIAQRLMDDLIDLELEKIDHIIKKIKKDPENEEIKSRELLLWQDIRYKCEQGRRTGTGLTAVADTVAAIGINYGSTKGINFINKLYKTLKLACYRSSVDMAKEIGPFPIYNHNKEKDCPFLLRIKDNDEQLWKDMKKFGRRNIALLTSPPAGSTSLLAKLVNHYGSSSAIECQYSNKPYIRRKKGNPSDKGFRTDFVDQNGDSWQEFKVYPGAMQDWMDITGETNIEKSPWHGACAYDIDWKIRVKLQATANRHIDHSISSTINLPEDATVSQVSDIYEEAWRSGCKGMTVYRNNCRTGVLVSEKNNESDQRNGEDIFKNNAPKRPKELPGELHFTKIKGENYFVIVGLMNKVNPYEIFIGNNGFIHKKGTLTGTIKKVKRGVYCGSFEKDIELSSVGKYCSDEEEALTRMASTALRHGADVSFVVHQLEKTKGDLQTAAKALARTLKKYIPDGSEVKGEECEKCKGKLMRESGCVLCKNCGWSRCG